MSGPADESLLTGGGVAGGNSFALRAPIAGVVAEVMAAVGASYDEGAALFRIVRTDEVELQVHVIVVDLPPVFTAFYEDEAARVCKNCGHLHPGKG